MILIFSLCLKLSILHFCVSDDFGYLCRPDGGLNHRAVGPTIYLITDLSNTYNQRMNSYFKSACQHTYNIMERYSMNEVSPTDYVIHFAATDYYDGKPLNGFVYAGSTMKKNNVDCLETDTENKTVCYEFSNLVSESIETLDDGHIYRYVENMNFTDIYTGIKDCKRIFQHTTDLTAVVICTNEDISHIHLPQPLKLQSLPRLFCSRRDFLNNFDNRLLAVLAPTPYDVENTDMVPTIFYETPYLTSEYKADFPNSINELPWRLLKYGFVKFIQEVGWRRVVLITDDSDFSIDFEVELIELMNKEGMMYTALRCEDAVCDMTKIAKELQEIGAKIIIANVNENHMQWLLDKFAGYKMTWIARDAPENIHKQETVYSISLRAVKNTNCQIYENILTGLNSISQAYNKLYEEDFKVTRPNFYRNFAKAMEMSSAELTEAEIIVTNRNQEIARMKANFSCVSVTFFNTPRRTTDGIGPCFALSYNYFKPCEDILLLLLMFVILVFVTTILLISCYFEKTSPLNEFHYRNFR